MLRAGKNGIRGIVASDPRQGVSEEEEVKRRRRRSERKKKKKKKKKKIRKIIEFKVRLRPYLGLMAAVKSLSRCFPVTLDVQASTWRVCCERPKEICLRKSIFCAEHLNQLISYFLIENCKA